VAIVRALIVVQRFGDEIAGGAEALARWVAQGLSGRGHHIEVLTSCARSYVTWANEIPSGTSVEDGLVVHRLPVDAPRDIDRFNRLSSRIDFTDRSTAPALERSWLDEQGPSLVGLEGWLDEHAQRFDIAIVYTYLYETAHRSIGRLAGRIPTILHATAHEEPPIHLRALQAAIRQCDLLLCSTPEEERLLRAITHGRVATTVIGIGVPPCDPPTSTAADDPFRLRGRPYLCVVGRVDPSKGVDELIRYFQTYKRRRPGDLALAVIGEAVHRLDRDDDVVHTGWVSTADRDRLVANSLLLVQPSYFESFSLALCEAWLLGRAALVNGWCDVLAGQAARSGGAIVYRAYREFEAALDLLIGDGSLRDALASAGRAYVGSNYAEGVVLDRLEAAVGDLIDVGAGTATAR
jgi:glycosyltransferase involved in cell wall biosynthesis